MAPAPVIRIAGVSYSGSTALGYFLNTAPGVVFGSELYRLLPAYLDAGGGRDETECDHCGAICTVWTPALRAALRARPAATLADVYDAFFAQAGAGAVLVDGSKSLDWYAPPARRRLRYLLSVKHPLRLAASHLGNDPALIPTACRTTLEAAARWLAEHPDKVRPRLRTLMAGTRERYLALTRLAADAPWSRRCRSDELDDVQSMLDGLGHDLGLRFDLDAAARTPCHALGGNRSLKWQSRGWSEPPLNPARDSARWSYYRDRATTGFLQDNKHEILLAGPVAGWAIDAARAADLFNLLGYREAA